MTRNLLCLLALAAGLAFGADQWPRIEHPGEGVTLVYDDFGNWGGWPMGVTPQVTPELQVRKTIDLSRLPKRVLAAAKQARLRVYFAILDYSSRKGKWNGLDEAFELHVNGHVHTYRTNCGFPASAKKADPLKWHWVEFGIPVAELTLGKNAFLFRKAESDAGKYDDFIYVGLDNTEVHGNSAVSWDAGKTWTTEKLNVRGTKGEYMVRLVLIAKDMVACATWRPNTACTLDDPAGLVGYAEPTGDATSDGLRLRAAAPAVLEFDTHRIDATRSVSAEVQFAGRPPVVTWRSYSGDALKAATTVTAGHVVSVVPAKLERPATLTLAAAGAGGTEVRQVTVKASLPYMQAEPLVDMAPRICPAKGGPIRLAPECQVRSGQAVLRDSLLECRLETKPRLRMTSLVNRYTGRDVLLKPGLSRLLLLEIGSERFGAEDFRVRGVAPLTDAKGLAADLVLDKHGLAARLTMALAEPGQLRLGLELTNEGREPLDFKLAFPHLAGIGLSEDWRDDYYLFPYCGGIIASVPTYLRTAYGENSAWWQMIDLFSPSRGAGLFLRCLDETGLYKCPVLCKGKTQASGYSTTLVGRGYMDRSLPWENSLAPGKGIAVAFEYLKRTRAPGKSFSPPDALIAVHDGDWHAAMREYSQWAHTVWKWRPYPSKLHDCFNIGCAGWGDSPLYKDGAYRTDVIRKSDDVIELMAFWKPSDVGPWRVPVDQLRERLGETFYRLRKSWCAVHPTTGKPCYRLNCPDYQYHPGWGGLPALLDYIKTIRAAGVLPMFYMNGKKACDSSEVGHEYGPKYGVKNPRWVDPYKTGMTPKGYAGPYAAYEMCTDTAWWQDYLTATVKRLCADTGVAGVRLDQYGHAGIVCESAEHEHMFAEPGHNACLQATAQACRKVRAAMDEVSSELVLTTEYPGYDRLACYLEGSIVYETMRAAPIRPVPCNLFRFYFPECKGYDLESRRTPHAQEWKVWNAMAAFGPPHPPKYHHLLKENADLFGLGQAEPLIPTLVPLVYANQFTSRAKQITLLYNARGYTVDGPLVAVEPKPAHHFVELLRCQELRCIRTDNGHAIGLKLRRDQVGCIARLPKRLTVSRDLDRLVVRVAGPADGMTVALCAAAGARLQERPAAPEVVLTLPTSATAGGQPACVKLMGAKYLVDAAGVCPR